AQGAEGNRQSAQQSAGSGGGAGGIQPLARGERAASMSAVSDAGLHHQSLIGARRFATANPSHFQRLNLLIGFIKGIVAPTFFSIAPSALCANASYPCCLYRSLCCCRLVPLSRNSRKAPG